MDKSGKGDLTAQLYPLLPQRKFVMVIDLAKCKNARKCVEQCQKSHHLPPNQELMKVYLMQESEEDLPYWMPKPCFHCDKPLCLEACQTGATIKSEDGIVLIDKALCIGCKNCINACPYSSRHFRRNPFPDQAGVHPPSNSIDSPGETTGISKCDFCKNLVEEGKLPQCVTACPSGTIYFGDRIADIVSNGLEQVSFSELISSRLGFQHLGHFGTKPNVYYLPPDPVTKP
jgi:molybdopterin-containing oxidoreductase family iron-sulfur binding subunit